MQETLFADEYVTISLHPEIQLVRYTRSAKAFPSIDIIRTHHAALPGVLVAVSPKDHALLIDVRSAPPRNDEAFEAEITRLMAALVTKFRAHAFLVKTAVGSLQVRRLSAARGVAPNRTFSNEPAALAYLAAPSVRS